MSPRRLALGGAAALALAAALAGLIVLLGSGDDDIGASPDDISEQEVASLGVGSCPPRYEVLRSGEPEDAEVDAARRGRFEILDEEVTLRPPVEWTINPIDARAFAHNLFKFQWIDPLLFAYRERGDRAALEQATALALDFARANPPDGDPVDPDVWGDKRTADRAPYVAYILSAASCEGLLEEDEEKLMLALIERHAEVMTDPDLYKPSNHGLFVDLGLTLLARQLDDHPDAESWAETGRSRFTETLSDRTVADEGFWLEHSAGYQILVSRAVVRFLEVPGNETPELADLLRRMQDVAGWLRQPDGMIPQLGDSDRKPVPKFAERRALDDRGVLELDDSGLAIVKEEGGFLAVMASYFSGDHKHSDALTFDLFDGGRRLITDTGLYHKDKDENFRFAHSERAHSVLTVDGAEFPRDGSATYGSGIIETGKGHGYRAILGTNPAVRAQGVSHRRLFVYKPGRALVIVDRLRATDGERHRYARFLQFAPEIEVRRGGGGLALSAPDFSGAVRIGGAPGQRIELAKGERNPLRGLTSPSFRRWVPRTTARIRSKGGDASLITAITIDGPPLRAELTKWSEERIGLELRSEGGVEERLALLTGEDGYRIERVGGSGGAR